MTSKRFLSLIMHAISLFCAVTINKSKLSDSDFLDTGQRKT